jgi:predicted NBD/HSP70 family sugar kinase
VVDQALNEKDPAGQQRALAALNTAAKLIGTAIGPAVTMLNVERVVLGGIGGTVTYPLIVESLRQGLDRTAPRQARTDAQIRASMLGDEASVVGAALTSFERHGIDFLIDSAARPESARETQEKVSLAG